MTAIAVALPASAQAPAGAVTGHVVDSTGLSLPGVAVTLQGLDAAKTFVTEADGRFRFLELAPGPYKVTSALQGFATNVREKIILDLGRNVDLFVTMQLSEIHETLTVAAPSPMVDATQTGTATNFTNDELSTITEPLVDGGQFAPQSSGQGLGNIYINAKWQFNANGFYQLGGGFEIGANLFGRQGYAEPLIFQKSTPDGRLRVMAVPEIDTLRYPNLWDLDLRLAKTISLQRVKLLLSADVFNVLNSNTELSRARIVDSAAFHTLNEVISPRIARIGVKFQF